MIQGSELHCDADDSHTDSERLSFISPFKSTTTDDLTSELSKHSDICLTNHNHVIFTHNEKSKMYTQARRQKPATLETK